MNALDELRDTIPEPARDIRINLQSVLDSSSLSPGQKWGVAIACAIAARSPRLRDVLIASARGELGAESEAVIDDAMAAAAIMAMNNVFYRFRHMVGSDSYGQRPARLRMQRIAKPATSKGDFELICLAVSAINGCEVCIRSHEQAVRSQSLNEDHVHDAVRLAATINATAVALELPAPAIA